MSLKLDEKKIAELHDETILKLLASVGKYRTTENKRRWESYKPLPAQLRLHKCQAQTRCLIGGNRLGKTTAGIVEVLWYCFGRHPFRTVLPPTNIWVVALDSQVLSDTILPKLFEYLPAEEIKSWNQIRGRLELRNGSIIQFKSCDSGSEKFQSAERRLIWFDEEPPEDVWNECQVRVGADFPLDILLTMTPLKGIDWTFERLVEKQSPGKIEVMGGTMLDNHHIPKSERQRLVDLWQGTADEPARMRGEYFERSGLIYRGLDDQRHTIDPFPIPKDWPYILAVDPHPRKPSAAVWAALGKDDILYFTDELNDQNEMLFTDFVARVKEISHKKRIVRQIIDPSALAKNQQTGKSTKDYLRSLGLSTTLANNDVKVGYDLVRRRISGPRGPGMFFFRGGTPKTWTQLKRLVYDEWRGRGIGKDVKEVQRKLNDDLADCVRYIVATQITFDGGAAEKTLDEYYRNLHTRSTNSSTGYVY